jgi:hypothetical protein
MKDSVTYQWIVEQGVQKGRAEGMAALLLLQGEQRFGTPYVATRNALARIADLDRLSRIAARLNATSDWQDWLATP